MLCISASGMDGGVRSKVMRLDPTRWSLTPLPEIAGARALALLSDEHGAGYDWTGILRLAAPILGIGESRRRWFCSEFVAAAMGIAEPWRFAPVDLVIIATSARSAAE
jgi:hypothetical protein